MSDKHRNPALRNATAAFIEELLSAVLVPMREVARHHGYALALHGSLARDIDIVAVPWAEHAVDPDKLVQSIQGAIAGVLGSCYVRKDGDTHDWSDKPHGRRAVTFLLPETHVWIDLSVTPRTPEPEPPDGGQ